MSMESQEQERRVKFALREGELRQPALFRQVQSRHQQ